MIGKTQKSTALYIDEMGEFRMQPYMIHLLNLRLLSSLVYVSFIKIQLHWFITYPIHTLG